MKATLVFLAAGFGSRFGGGIKQIEPIGPNGEVLMDYAVYDALRAGFDRVVFIIRRDIEEAFRRGVGQRIEKKCDVEYVYQELSDLPAGFRVPEGRVKPWGTGQAVLACRTVIDGPFCVLNADDYYGPHAFEQVYSYLQTMNTDGKMDCCMVGYVLDNTLSRSGPVTRGICHVDEEGKLLSIQECRGIEMVDGEVCMPDADGLHALRHGMAVSMNMWGLPAAFIDYLAECFPPFLESLPEGDLKGEYLLPTIIGGMVESGCGSVQVLNTHERWFGMTYAEDKIQARKWIEKLIAEGVYPEKI